MGVRELLTPLRGSGPTTRLSSSATIQTHIQDLVLGLSNIYPLYVPLQHVKGLVLGNHSCRISMTGATEG